MKKLLFTLCAMMIAMASYAQNLLVATLTHGEDVSIYYGAAAFQSAMEAAEDGDVINLSGGGFLSADIKKAVTIHGIGVDEALPTSLMGDLAVDIPAEATGRLMMEGVQIRNVITISGTTNQSCFIKCRIVGNVKLIDDAINSQFLNCELAAMNMSGNATAQYVGSYVQDMNIEGSAGADFVNCVVAPSLHSNSSCYADRIRRSTLLNCIVVNRQTIYHSNFSLPNTSTAQDCISVGPGNPFDTFTGSNNTSGVARTFFVDSDIKKDLTDEAKELYLGADGTPVGMYGGVFPFNTIPGYPRITKLNADPKASADGKINVEIEVSTVEP